ncbi:hypothetical protein SESBI_41528 [Sesbania bispinosa]|nr:hypothetical protein SESBI_41528 [Sesbania bispinosa]
MVALHFTPSRTGRQGANGRKLKSIELGLMSATRIVSLYGQKLSNNVNEEDASSRRPKTQQWHKGSTVVLFSKEECAMASDAISPGSGVEIGQGKVGSPHMNPTPLVQPLQWFPNFSPHFVL